MPKVYTIDELRLTPAQAIFAAENIKIANKLVNVWFKRYPFFGYDNIYDTVITAFIKAVRTFDEEKGRFSTYIYYVTQREIHKFIRDQNAAKRKGETVSMDAERFDTEDTMHDLIGDSDRYVFEEVDWLRKASSLLSEREKRLILYTIMEGISQKDAAQLEGISQMHVSRIVKQGLSKMKQYASLNF